MPLQISPPNLHSRRPSKSPSKCGSHHFSHFSSPPMYALSPFRTHPPGPPDVVDAPPLPAVWTPEPWSNGETSALSTPGARATSALAAARSALALVVTHGGDGEPAPLLSLRLGARRTLLVSDHAATKEFFTTRDVSTAARKYSDAPLLPTPLSALLVHGTAPADGGLTSRRSLRRPQSPGCSATSSCSRTKLKFCGASGICS
jgi:hypothetical protein